ncbi:MAG: undecaprenyl-diphosphatase [Pantoea sp.]|uniref:undecaprenyl-diphosphatase n=1 Tax=Pantoea sp. TaxID=69393 RepID=UPI00238923E9|nr:undecaprenyl-diphosphatase [Pantoea sp.]MDE1188012.1 undecaprenyl-diphosphatase [Pantoea sp.]
MFLTSETAGKINDTLFLLINAPVHASSLMLTIGNACAAWLVFIFPLALLIYWFSFKTEKQQVALLALISALLALSVNLVIGNFFPHPRPFMVPIGHTFISHVADSSFPSDHMTLACAVAFSFLLGQRIYTGVSLLLLSLFIAWGRIYMGVHFPADMLGSVLVAWFCSWGVKKAEYILIPLFKQLYRLNDAIFGYLRNTRVKH